MTLSTIIILVVAVLIAVKLFSGAKPLALILGFIGIYFVLMAVVKAVCSALGVSI